MRFEYFTRSFRKLKMKIFICVFSVFISLLIVENNTFAYEDFGQKNNEDMDMGKRRLIVNKQALEKYMAEKLAERQKELEEIYCTYHAKEWENFLSEDGLRYFEPQRVEEVMRQEGFDQYYPEYFCKPVGIVFEKSIFYPEGIYYVSDTTPIVNAINKTRKSKIASDVTQRRHVPFVEIRHEPTLLMQSVKGGKPVCAVISPRYEVSLTTYCQNVKSYKMLSEQRVDVIKAAGFSDEIAEKYGRNNPWNLRVYNQCETFDGILMVEKVVLAWRYVTIANSIAQNHQKDFRYVYFRQDRVEHEIEPQSNETLPKCHHFAGTSWKERKGFSSDVQPWPFEYSYSSDTPQYRDFAVGEMWNF